MTWFRKKRGDNGGNGDSYAPEAARLAKHTYGADSATYKEALKDLSDVLDIAKRGDLTKAGKMFDEAISHYGRCMTDADREKYLPEVFKVSKRLQEFAHAKDAKADEKRYALLCDNLEHLKAQKKRANQSS